MTDTVEAVLSDVGIVMKLVGIIWAPGLLIGAGFSEAAAAEPAVKEAAEALLHVMAPAALAGQPLTAEHKAAAQDIFVRARIAPEGGREYAGSGATGIPSSVVRPSPENG